MNIIQFSNYCNLIAQQSGFLGYHYGYESEINRNVDNNTNPNNAIGNRFPFVLLEPISGSMTFLKAIDSTNEIRLNFFALQHYNNDGTINQAQSIQQMQSLLDSAKQFIYMLFNVAKTPPSTFGIVAATVRFETMESQHNDRLLQVVANLTISWKEECPDLEFDPAAVAAPFEFPPSDAIDYETLKPV